MGNKTFDKFQGVLKMVVSIITAIFILLVIIMIVTGNDDRFNLSFDDISSIISQVLGVIIGVSFYFIFSVYLFLSGKLQFKSQKSKYRVLYFLSIPISSVILFWFIIVVIGIFKNPNSLTEIGALIVFFILLLIVYVIIEDAFYQFSRKKYEVPTNNQDVVNPIANPNPITPIIEEQKIVNNIEIYPEVKKINNSNFSKLEKLFMVIFTKVIQKHIIRFKNLNKGFLRLITVGSILIPIPISLLSDWQIYGNKWSTLLLYFVLTILLYWLIVFIDLWIFKENIKLKKLKKGLHELIITGSIFIPFLVAIFIKYDEYLNKWIPFIIYFVISTLIYWIIVFVGLWIYDGFKVEKNTDE